MAGAFSPGSIGLIGAGLMGTAFAERLLAAGFHVIMWDRDASRMAPLSALGAESAANAVVVGARCACTILSLPNSDVIRLRRHKAEESHFFSLMTKSYTVAS